MADLDAIRRDNPLPHIAAKLVALRPAGQEWVACCPFHADRSPSFTIFDGGRRFHCFGCNASGDVLDFARRAYGVTLPEAVQMLGAGDVPKLGQPTAGRVSRAIKGPDTLAAARSIWNRAAPAAGTPAEAYLRFRGIVPPYPPSLRFQALYCDNLGPLPCLVASVQDPAGDVIGIQRIWLAYDGQGKAQVAKPKRSLGQVKGGAIRLGDLDGSCVLTVCEGPEDGLSLLDMIGGPVWVAAGATFLPAMQFPADVHSIVIGADNDPAGQKAARDAAQAFAARGMSVRIIRPLEGFKDFNDELGGHSDGRQSKNRQPSGQCRDGEACGRDRQPRTALAGGTCRTTISCRSARAAAGSGGSGAATSPSPFCHTGAIGAVGCLAGCSGSCERRNARRGLCAAVALLPHHRRFKGTQEPCDEDLMQAVADHEAAQDRLYREWRKAWAIDLAIWKERYGFTLAKIKKGTADRSALVALGPEPEPPARPERLVREPTYEGLTRLLAEGQPSLGLFSNEGGQFLGGFAMSPDNRQKTLAALNDLWQGNAIKRSRQGGEGTKTLFERRLALHLMAQPIVAHALLGDPLAGDTGFLPRCLICEPPSTIGTRPHRGQMRDTKPVEAFADRLAALLITGMAMDPETRALNPWKLYLSVEARVRLEADYNETEAEQSPGGPLEMVRGHANKTAEQAARIAGVLTLWQGMGRTEVCGHAMDCGIALARYYLGEAVRLAGAALVSDAVSKAEALGQWMLSASWGKPWLTLRDITRLRPNRLREGPEALKAIDLLIDHGWLIPQPPGTIIEGKARKRSWRIRHD